ncbi:MAG: cytochrome c maturation protein CcmE [Gammaproteobacteria bacterium]|nr:cytochrome c maturation protein CcmE [Gammaproteobacteria bacterium]
MHPLRKQRLMIVAVIVLGASLGTALIALALRDNLNLFYEPERVAAGEAPLQRTIRVGGMVVPGSVQRDPQTLAVEFKLTDYSAEVAVRYQGILPDLFAENAGAVVTGRLQPGGLFVAEQVLAKHDEKYMPPEVAKAIEGKHPGAASGDYAGSGEGSGGGKYVP